jgi:hypothetical protein
LCPQLVVGRKLSGCFGRHDDWRIIDFGGGGTETAELDITFGRVSLGRFLGGKPSPNALSVRSSDNV